MSGPHGLFISGAYAASSQIGGQGSARWFSKIIRPYGVILRAYPEDMTWQR